MTWSMLCLCLSGLCLAAALWLVAIQQREVDAFWKTYDD